MSLRCCCGKLGKILCVQLSFCFGVVMKVSVMQVITFDGSGVVMKVSVMQVITFDGSGVVMKVSVMQVITFDGSGVVIKVSVMQVITLHTVISQTCL